MQNNNGMKQRFLNCFLKILDKKRKNWRELLPDQYHLSERKKKPPAYYVFYNQSFKQGFVLLLYINPWFKLECVIAEKKTLTNQVLTLPRT